MRELLQSKTPLTLIAATILASGIGIPISAVFADTNTEHQVTETTTDVNPCTGEPGTLTITYNEIEHQSSDNKGGSHATFTQTGTFTFEQDDEEVTFTGHFTIWGGFNSNSGGTNVGTFTFSIHGTGSDGSSLKANSVSHTTSNPADIITSEFEKINCH